MPAIFEKLGIAYFGIPKVMSTTLLNTLYELEHGRPFLEAEHDGQVAHDVFPQPPQKPKKVLLV